MKKSSSRNWNIRVYLTMLLMCMMVLVLNTHVKAESEVVDDDEKYEQDILTSTILAQDKEMLLEDEGFRKQYDELVREGWVLTDISVENCENDANISGVQPYGSDKTYYTRRGKVITSSFVQKEKTTKKYNNKIYNTYQKVQNRISFAISAVSQGKISWIASTLFSIDVTDYAPFVNTGYQKVTENATLHMKDAYYKEGKKYWLGYSVKKLNVAGTVFTYFKDKKENPHQKSKSYSKTFTTQNYNKSNDDLVRLARKYYNTGWVNEKITASQTIRVN